MCLTLLQISSQIICTLLLVAAGASVGLLPVAKAETAVAADAEMAPWVDTPAELVEREKQREADWVKYDFSPKIRRIMHRLTAEGPAERESIAREIDAFVVENENSPFLAELLYKAGAMFGPGRGEEQPFDRERMVHYFQRADDLYAGRHSIYSISLRSHLANERGGHPLRLRYYQSFLDIRDDPAAIDSIYPIRSITAMMRSPRPPAYTEEEKQAILVSMQDSLPMRLEAAERWILQRARPDELDAIAEHFPGTALADGAREVSLKRTSDMEPETGTTPFPRGEP